MRGANSEQKALDESSVHHHSPSTKSQQKKRPILALITHK